MMRLSKIVSLCFVFAIVGLVLADTASAAGLGRRGRTNCDSCSAEPACAAAEPACAAAEPACCAAEPACAAAEPACCAEPQHRGRARRGLLSRRAKSSGAACTSCCAEPGCAAAEPACGACAGG
jgi:hypothetical protein